MRLDLIALLPVILMLGFIVLKFAKPGKAGKIWIYIMWSVALIFEIYWLVTGALFGGS